MRTRWPKFLFATALIVFLFAQPFAALAFTGCSSMSAMSCCKDKCCRKMHPAPTEPGVTSQSCHGQCHVSVRNTQPVPANLVSLPGAAGPAHLPSDFVFRGTWLPPSLPNPVQFERPPPSAA